VSLVILGHPRNKIGVYMEPLIDELVRVYVALATDGFNRFEDYF
jgi:hypothetical protein